MKTFMTKCRGRHLGRILPTAVLLAGLMLGATACKTTRQARSVQESGFLSDYSQLHKGKSGQAKLVYINPSVDWAKYTKVCILPVELWKSEDTNSPLGGLSHENQQYLVDFAYMSLSNALQRNFEIVSAPGPDTIVVRAAITEAKKSGPVRNLLTTVVPFGIAANLLKTVAFGSGIGVGQVQGEVELLDGQTHQRLLAAVDRRVGTKALRTKFNSRWSDVKDALDYWAGKLDSRLVALRSGKPDSAE